MTVIQPVAIERLPEVLLLALSHLTPENQSARVEALARDAETGRLTSGGIMEARRDGQLVGAIFSQVQGGASGLIWPPALLPGEPDETRGLLMQAVLDHFRLARVRVANLLFDDEASIDTELADRFEFCRLATIEYMVATEPIFPRQCPVAEMQRQKTDGTDELQLVGMRPERRQHWTELLESTFVDTLDCPGLEKMRTPGEIIDGYLATGSYMPSFWNVIRHQQRDVGCLIMLDHPDQDMCELAYMGLVPEARGNGRGRVIARYAQWLARLARRSQLLVGVDCANPPARKAYVACGFEPLCSRAVFVRELT